MLSLELALPYGTYPYVIKDFYYVELNEIFCFREKRKDQMRRAALKNCCSCENMNFFGDRIKELHDFREILSKTVNVWRFSRGKTIFREISLYVFSQK